MDPLTKITNILWTPSQVQVPVNELWILKGLRVSTETWGPAHLGLSLRNSPILVMYWPGDAAACPNRAEEHASLYFANIGGKSASALIWILLMS